MSTAKTVHRMDPVCGPGPAYNAVLVRAWSQHRGRVQRELDPATWDWHSWDLIPLHGTGTAETQFFCMGPVQPGSDLVAQGVHRQALIQLCGARVAGEELSGLGQCAWVPLLPHRAGANPAVRDLEIWWLGSSGSVNSYHCQTSGSLGIPIGRITWHALSAGQGLSVSALYHSEQPVSPLALTVFKHCCRV